MCCPAGSPVIAACPKRNSNFSGHNHDGFNSHLHHITIMERPIVPCTQMSPHLSKPLIVIQTQHKHAEINPPPIQIIPGRMKGRVRVVNDKGQAMAKSWTRRSHHAHIQAATHIHIQPPCHREPASTKSLKNKPDDEPHHTWTNGRTGENWRG